MGNLERTLWARRSSKIMHKNHLKMVIFSFKSEKTDENPIPKPSLKSTEKALFSYILNKAFSSFLHPKD
jgi:hypothetical protein